MDEHNRKDDLHVEGEGKEAKTRPEEKDVARREFLRKAGQAGLSAGLASFLLIGGKLRTAVADGIYPPLDDNCSPPYMESNNDPDNDDACEVVNTTPPQWNTDKCGAPPNEIGDDCSSLHDQDECADPAATRVGGDECSSPLINEHDICLSTNQRDGADFCGTFPGTQVTDPDVCEAVSGGNGEWGDHCGPQFPDDPDACGPGAGIDEDICDASNSDWCNAQQDPNQPDVPGY